MDSDLTSTYLNIHEYCCRLSNNFITYTTPNYIAYKDKYVFVELHFHKDHLRLYLYDTDYNDPQGKTHRLNNSYKWSKNVAIEIYINDDIEYVKNIIKQSYDYSLL